MLHINITYVYYVIVSPCLFNCSYNNWVFGLRIFGPLLETRRREISFVNDSLFNSSNEETYRDELFSQYYMHSDKLNMFNSV